MKTKLSLAVFSMVLLFLPKNAAAQCSTYGGRATVFQANVASLFPVVLADTGSINSTGGINDASLLNASVLGLLSAEALSATAGGSGNSTLSQASMAGLSLSVAGNTIGAGLVLAEAKAYCGNGVSARSEIDGLVVNGQSITVTGAPNQTVSLFGGGFITLNEQISDPINGGITVNAIHVSVPVVADVVISSAYAAISGQLVGASGGPARIVALLLQRQRPMIGTLPLPCANGEFFTGGGWINDSSSVNTIPAKKNFGVSGGVNPGGNTIGHLEYVDHADPMINVHGTGVLNCLVSSSGQVFTGTITGSARVNGATGCNYTVTVTDDDSGNGPDMFGIILMDDGSNTCPPQYSSYAAGPDPLGGGDIEYHQH